MGNELIERVGKCLHPSLYDDDCCEVRVGDLRALLSIARGVADNEARMAEFEAAGLCWRNPAPHAAAPNVPNRSAKMTIDGTGRTAIAHSDTVGGDCE